MSTFAVILKPHQKYPFQSFTRYLSKKFQVDLWRDVLITNRTLLEYM
jgi:hypothetical protein